MFQKTLFLIASLDDEIRGTFPLFPRHSVAKKCSRNKIPISAEGDCDLFFAKAKKGDGKGSVLQEGFSFTILLLLLDSSQGGTVQYSFFFVVMWGGIASAGI